MTLCDKILEVTIKHRGSGKLKQEYINCFNEFHSYQNYLIPKYNGVLNYVCSLEREYFEDYDFVNLTDAIFKAAGSNYWDFPSYEGLLTQKDNFEQQIQQLIRRKQKNKRIWGWKDPWTNILIELFLPYLTNPYFVVIFRNPLAVAKSAVKFTRGKRNEFWVKHPITFFHGLQIANFYDRIILEFFGKYPTLPHFFISFEDIIDNPTRETIKMAKFLGLTLTKQQMNKILGFVTPRSKMAEERRGFKDRS